MRTLLVGGARSGKSSLAAEWAAERSQNVCCVVTATVSDAEMAARIAAHRLERPQHWRTREEPRHLSKALPAEAASGAVVLIDCLTLWTSNCLWPAETHFQTDLAGWHAERDAFLEALRNTRAEVLIVSNEVGTGPVPENAVARLFRDEQGRLNQLVAVACDAAFWVTAGLALRLK